MNRMLRLVVLLTVLAAGCTTAGNPVDAVGDKAAGDVEADLGTPDTTPACEEGALGCEDEWTTICQGGVWVRVTDCAADGSTCVAGKCSGGADVVPDIEPDLPVDVLPDVPGDVTDVLGDLLPDVTPDVLPDVLPDVTPDVLPDVLPDVPDFVAPDADADALDVSLPDLDVAGPDVADIAQDLADAADVLADTALDLVNPDQGGQDVAADAADASDVQGPECTSGPCCSNGSWLAEGAPCATGLDEFDCTEDTCGADHQCKHTLKAEHCLIESVCYLAFETSPDSVCSWCEPAESAVAWTFKPVTESCDDGLFCNGKDFCDGSGVCAHGTDPCAANPVCSRICNEQTDVCFAPPNVMCRKATGPCDLSEFCDGNGNCPVDGPAQDGIPCDDGDMCSAQSICESGQCVGTTFLQCTALDQCHAAGLCDPETGTCSDPEKPNGTFCDDGDPITVNDMCTGGVCAGVDLCAGVVCTAKDQCHVAGVCDQLTGLCSNPVKQNGTACNDGNACTQTDTCQAGACVGANPVVCTALDQCHDVGTCNTATGVCSNPNKLNGTACNDGNACTQTDTCQTGTCVGANPVVCTALDQCHDVGTCDTATGVCSNPNKLNGTACNDGNACTQTDTCQTGACVGANPVICTALDQCHDVGVCDTSTGVCSNPNKLNGTACNDGNACTQTDTCQTGACVGANPVICTALDQCHDVGVCDTSTGVCSNPNKLNGTICNDGNACTQTDTCQTGACVGANPVVCTAMDQCHVAGTCDTSTGVCSNPAAKNGLACNDGNACTQTDACQAGVCTGANPVVCTALDQCHDVGTCDTSTGVCSNPNKLDGSACNDGNACTQTDTCQTGACTGTNPVICTALDQCHNVGTCNTTTGVCSNPNKLDGTACNDGNACTQTDTCQTGACTGSNPVICTALDQCHDVGTCNTTTGVCSNPNKLDGTACNDGNACTQTDTCQTGACTGANPVICTALDQCHDVGTCNTTTGVCSNPNKLNGTACDDGNACTLTDVCGMGVCVGTEPVTCTAEDQCHDAGVCDSATGVCSTPAKLDGTACNDTDACTLVDTCQAGVCVGASPVVCLAADQCHEAGTCDPATGWCSNPNKVDGSTCNDGNACTQTDTCQTGTCVGSSPVVCTAQDQCHSAGVCDPATGVCSNPNRPNGTTCNDSDACTQADTCQFGVCVGANPVLCTAMDQCHNAGICDPATGVCNNPAKVDGSACNDGNGCTQTDTCQNGTCTGSNPVVCTALDQCHIAGTCNPATGMCSNPNKVNGTACNDANACTQTDTCQNGTCTGSNPVTCTAMDQCHDVGTCNTTTGVCSNPNKLDGTACNDGNACTQTDTCQTGACTGANPVVCTALDQCHDVGSCNTTTGVCSNPNKLDGTACNDGNACTQTDTCQTGACTGANPVICTALDQCHLPGTCNPASGVCSNPNKANGTTCNDANGCSQTDTCQNGTCTGTNPVVCTAMDQCHLPGTCNPGDGTCSNPPVQDGTTCNDGNPLTWTDTCVSGVCVGVDLCSGVTCEALDQCHVPGVCNPETGVCSNPLKTNGSSCNDNNGCTQTDTCQAGICTGSNPLTCTAMDQCHVAGTCDPETGLCSNPPKTDGTSCNDANACTQTDTCQDGTCTGSNPVTCTASDQCHAVGVCNPATGTCNDPPKPDGSACNDFDPCSQTDTCQEGTCVGENPVVCLPLDQCHIAGTCDPETGLCSDPPKVNGTACNDGDACTQTDSCQAGACLGGNPVVCVAMDQCHAAGLCIPSNGSCTDPIVADGTACDDGNGSTVNDTCVLGICAGVDLCAGVTCVALDQCHDAGTCSPETGMCSTPNKPNGTTCDDGDSLTVGDVCTNGVCIGALPPTVVSTSPAAGATVVAGDVVSVTFSTAMQATSLTGQTAAGACSGSVQVSLDDFASCVAFASAAPLMSGGDTTATFILAPGMLVNRQYKFRVTTAATSAALLTLGATYTSATAFSTLSPNLCEGSVVISQVYGGAGGSLTTVPNADYVVLHNRGSQSVSLGGWSVQYASATGTTWAVVALSGSIQPDSFYLVKMSSAGTGIALPTPDASSNSVAMSATAGKVALVSSTNTLSGSCPVGGPTVVDFVGYGTTANCREGSANTPAPSSTTALFRNQNGCGDVNENSTDFTVATPNPMNSASPPAACACLVHNESSTAPESDYCVLQFPATMAVAATAGSLPMAYGRLYEAGVTEAAGANGTVRAQFGWGVPAKNPQYQSWTWSNASFNSQFGNDDEYMSSGAVPVPIVGSYRYAFRFSVDQGVSWTVCDLDGAGSNAGLWFTFDSQGVLTVTP